MIKIELVKDMLYLCDNEKGKTYIQCISIYESGKTHSDIIYIHRYVYDSMYKLIIDSHNIIKY